jgi:hypothetical protein
MDQLENQRQCEWVWGQSQCTGKGGREAEGVKVTMSCQIEALFTSALSSKEACLKLAPRPPLATFAQGSLDISGSTGIKNAAAPPASAALPRVAGGTSDLWVRPGKNHPLASWKPVPPPSSYTPSPCALFPFSPAAVPVLVFYPEAVPIPCCCQTHSVLLQWHWLPSRTSWLRICPATLSEAALMKVREARHMTASDG